MLRVDVVVVVCSLCVVCALLVVCCCCLFVACRVLFVVCWLFSVVFVFRTSLHVRYLSFVVCCSNDACC